LEGGDDKNGGFTHTSKASVVFISLWKTQKIYLIWLGQSYHVLPLRRGWHFAELHLGAQNLHHRLLVAVQLSKACHGNCTLEHQHKNLSSKRIISVKDAEELSGC
jgi:hypothetical protein